MMLFDQTAFEGCDTREDLDATVTIAKKKRRWDPIAPGFVCLALVSVGPEKTGNWGNAWHEVTFTVVGRSGTRAVGRRMFERFTVAGETKVLREMTMKAKSQVKSGLLCHSAEVQGPFHPMQLHGLIVPIEVTKELRFNSKKEVNGAKIVCAHPQSSTYGKYLELVERVGPETYVVDGGEILDRVPGWRLHPDSPAAAIMERMMDRAEAVESSDDFEMEIAATSEVARREQLDRMIPKLFDQIDAIVAKLDGKRERAARATATAGKDTTPDKAASRALKAEKASAVLEKAEGRLFVLRARLADLLAERAAMDDGTWKPAVKAKAAPETVVMTHAEIMAQIAKPLSQHERDRRAAVAAAASAEEEAYRAVRAAMSPEQVEAERKATAVRQAQARLDQTESRGYTSFQQIADAKRRREAKALDEEIRKARLARIPHDPAAAAEFRRNLEQDISDRNAGRERTTTVVYAAPATTSPDMVDGVRADLLPRDHPDWCPF